MLRTELGPGASWLRPEPLPRPAGWLLICSQRAEPQQLHMPCRSCGSQMLHIVTQHVDSRRLHTGNAQARLMTIHMSQVSVRHATGDCSLCLATA